MHVSFGRNTPTCVCVCVCVSLQAFIEVPSFDRVVGSVLEHGVKTLPDHCFLTPGIPVKVMLGKPAKGIDEVLKRLAGAMFTIEYKYDGERAQIHYLQVHSRVSLRPNPPLLCAC